MWCCLCWIDTAGVWCAWFWLIVASVPPFHFGNYFFLSVLAYSPVCCQDLFLGCWTSQQHAKCISGTDLPRQLNMSPYWDRSCRLTLDILVSGENVELQPQSCKDWTEYFKILFCQFKYRTKAFLVVDRRKTNKSNFFQNVLKQSMVSPAQVVVWCGIGHEELIWLSHWVSIPQSVLQLALKSRCLVGYPLEYQFLWSVVGQPGKAGSGPPVSLCQ